MRAQTIKKLALVGALLLLVAAFFVFDLQQYLTFSYLKSQQQAFREYYEQHAFLTLSGYFLFYIIVVTLNLPGAVVMSLAGAALFGFWPALITVSFASSLGATLACMVSRYLLRDWVQARFEDKLMRINNGVAKEGAFYLFTLRLIPAVPFFIINLAMGLTPMRLWTFYWVSQLGMLPGTIVYLNAGRELGELESLSGIFSPGLLVSFALLGIFPLAMKKGLGWYRKRKGLQVRPVVSKESDT